MCNRLRPICHPLFLANRYDLAEGRTSVSRPSKGSAHLPITVGQLSGARAGQGFHRDHSVEWR
jgi:hypothetical protein